MKTFRIIAVVAAAVLYWGGNLNAQIIYVNSGATGADNGTSWANAYTSLQSALTQPLASGDEIWVAAGTYTPGLSSTDTFQLVPDVDLYGGFSGSETSVDQRDLSANETILSGDLDASGDHSAGDSYTVVAGADNVRLDGVTITLGYVNGAGGYVAALSIVDAKMAVVNCRFIDNDNTSYAGAVSVDGAASADTLFEDCYFEGNEAAACGGAIITNVSITIRRCRFENNRAAFIVPGTTNGGGAIGVFNWCAVTVENSVFLNNASGNRGGVYRGHTGGSATFKNCTMYGNSATSGSVLDGITSNENVVVQNSILRDGGNEAASSGTLTITYSNVQGYSGGTGNIDADPIFLSPTTGDLMLTENSPCIDAADGDVAPTTDYNGFARFDVLSQADSGTGVPTYADMGAYEFHIWFVDQSAGAGGDGASWATAFDDLQIALVQAEKADHIWVAAGTYYPVPVGTYTSASSERGTSFVLPEYVSIYGGFSGSETRVDARDWTANATILSGDIGRNDAGSWPALGNAGENSYHVVAGAEGVRLDGFTITRGYADGLEGVGDNDAAGMFNKNISGMITVANCVFTENHADDDGGAVRDNSSNGTFINCLFFSNEVSGSGGAYGAAMYTGFNSATTLINCTIVGNFSAQGGAIRNYSNSSMTIKNSIMWGNTTGGTYYNFVNSGTCAVTVTYSDIEGGWDISGAGNDGGTFSDQGTASNIDADPLFVDSANELFFVRSDSPCIDAADGDVAPITDYNGSARFDVLSQADSGTGAPSYADMGAYEFHVWFVDQSASAGGDGTSWATAFDDLQAALAACSPGDQIWVAAGSYYPVSAGTYTAVSVERKMSFVLPGNVEIYGGFSGTETRLADRDWTANATVLSGDIGRNDAGSWPTLGNVGENSYHVVVGGDGTRLDGFIITRGYADGLESEGNNDAGGMINISASVTVANCVFKENHADDDGGAVRNDTNSNGAFINCLFYWNDTQGSGSSSGAAMYNGYDSAPALINCTIAGNYSLDGSAIRNYSNSDMVMKNCIVWGNTTGATYYNFVNDGTSDLTIVNSDIEGGWDASGAGNNGGTFTDLGSNSNIDADPLFTDAVGSDFTLTVTSPCIDAGTGTDAPENDFAGYLRLDIPSVPNAAAGTSPFPDMGAYEYHVYSGFSGTVSGIISANVALSISGLASLSVSSDALGDYQFTNLYPGIYTVTPSYPVAGYGFSPSSTIVALSLTDITGVNFTTSLLPIFSLSGTISGDAPAGISLIMTGDASGTVVSDAAGHYSFGSLTNGVYTVTPSKAGYSFSPASRNITISGGDVGSLDFTATLLPIYSVSGVISGEMPDGVSLSISGTASANATTDGSGNYSFTLLTNGTYTVTPSQAGYVFSPSSTVVGIDGGDVTGVDFSSSLLPIYDVTGTISGDVFAGVTLSLTGPASLSVTSDASGNYSFGNLKNGTYTLTLSLSGYAFTPSTTVVVIAGGGIPDLTFTAHALPIFTLAGWVSGDTVAGVTINLTGPVNLSATTDASGHYSFSNLINEEYTVTPYLHKYKFYPANATVTISGLSETHVDFISEREPSDSYYCTASSSRTRAMSFAGFILIMVLSAGGVIIRRLRARA